MRTLLMITLLFSGAAFAQAKPLSPEEAEVAKTIKRAERAGFERYDAKAQLAIFDPATVWTFGRGHEPGPHDYRLTHPQQTEILAVRYSRPRAGSEKVYFNDETFDLKDGKGTYQALVERHFFGGIEAYNYRYTVEKAADGWRVTAVRVWPERQLIGGEPRMFDEVTYKELDREVKTAEEAGGFAPHFSALVNARRYLEAWPLAKAAAEAAPKDATMHAAVAFIAFELGKVDEAREAANRARAITRSIATPFHDK